MGMSTTITVRWRGNGYSIDNQHGTHHGSGCTVGMGQLQVAGMGQAVRQATMQTLKMVGWGLVVFAMLAATL